MKMTLTMMLIQTLWSTLNEINQDHTDEKAATQGLKMSWNGRRVSRPSTIQSMYKLTLKLEETLVKTFQITTPRQVEQNSIWCSLGADLERPQKASQGHQRGQEWIWGWATTLLRLSLLNWALRIKTLTGTISITALMKLGPLKTTSKTHMHFARTFWNAFIRFKKEE